MQLSNNGVGTATDGQSTLLQGEGMSQPYSCSCSAAHALMPETLLGSKHSVLQHLQGIWQPRGCFLTTGQPLALL